MGKNGKPRKIGYNAYMREVKQVALSVGDAYEAHELSMRYKVDNIESPSQRAIKREYYETKCNIVTEALKGAMVYNTYLNHSKEVAELLREEGFVVMEGDFGFLMINW